MLYLNSLQRDRAGRLVGKTNGTALLQKLSRNFRRFKVLSPYESRSIRVTRMVLLPASSVPTTLTSLFSYCLALPCSSS